MPFANRPRPERQTTRQGAGRRPRPQETEAALLRQPSDRPEAPGTPLEHYPLGSPSPSSANGGARRTAADDTQAIRQRSGRKTKATGPRNQGPGLNGISRHGCPSGT